MDSIHNGGQLRYRAPNRLYISTGDGGGRGDPLRTGQRLDTLLGKILRIDPRTPSEGRGYSIPAGNPFVGREGRDEIWAYGLRNPWRFSFDARPATWSSATSARGRWRRSTWSATAAAG